MSFIQNIKNYFAEKNIKKVLAFQNRHTYYRDFQSIKSVLILFKSDDDEKNTFIRDIISGLKSQGKRVTVWGYLDKKDSEAPVLPDFRLFGNKDLSFIKLPNKALTDEFLIQKYDMVFQLCCTDVYPLDYLLALSKAPFKVSKYKDYKGIADLMIQIDDSSDEMYLYNQILFYLNSIQAKN